MLPDISKIKGIHPGVILKRELKKRGLKNKDLAQMLNEHTQTISAILKERRGINPQLSIKLGKNLLVDADYFMLLQASYDVKQAYLKQKSLAGKPDLSKIRRALFWDTDFEKINWSTSSRAIIKRIFERGNDEEVLEIIHFYGMPIIKEELKKMKGSYLPGFEFNVRKYIGDQ